MLRQLGKRLADIRGLLDRLDASMISVNEGVTPESSRLEPFLPTVSRPSPSVTRKPDLPTVQRLAPPSHVTSGVLTTEDAEASAAAAAADVDLLRGSADKPRHLSAAGSDAVYDRRAHYGRRGVCLCGAVGGAGGAASARGRPAAAECGALPRRAGGGPEGVRRVAEEKVGANHEVMKREREWLCDRRWKALRATCLASSSRLRFW
ncbi:hypothetical protein EDB89DRAFT_1904832 [Lactarius sanguifluus]|nr:hypothetical protein EDB89DRAFT_1904832 [Lactarius sanguifluus]